MAGRHSFAKLIDKMPPARRAKSDARVKELMAEMLLSELRKYSGMTQQEVADILGITQPSLSKMESQEDMQINTLSRLVTSLGGKLELIARMPGGEIRLKQFAGE
ncbi:MAG: XRE family transcriptional regulator [Pirellulales bacterium]